MHKTRSPGSTITIEELAGHPGFRFDGPGGQRFRRETLTLLDMVAEKQLFKHRITSQIIPVTKICDSSVILEDGPILEVGAATRKLKGASHLLFGVCTIGPAVDPEIHALQLAGQHLRAVLLDSLASYALIQLANAMASRADDLADDMDLLATGRTNPGDNGFELTQQSTILDLAGADGIGVGLTSGLMMNPRFSVTAVFGIGSDVEKLHADRECDGCKAQSRCPYATFSATAMAQQPGQA